MAIGNFRISVSNNVPGLQPGARPGSEQVEAGLVEIGLFLEAEVAERTPIGVFGAAGGLRGSIVSETRGEPIREVIVGTPALYGPIVERGRRPGRMPPREPIQLWVQKKLGLTDARQVRAVAFLIARKIARQGTEGAKMFERAIAENNPALQRMVDRMGIDIVFDFGQGDGNP